MDLGLHVLPPFAKHTHTIIFLHGRDATAKVFTDEILESQDSKGQQLYDAFPSARLVFPQSEMRQSQRFQVRMSQWFDVWDVSNPDDVPEMQMEGLKTSARQLIRVIQKEAERVGLQNVILVGISQGCATAVHALLNFPEIPEAGGLNSNGEPQRLGAFVGLCSWMPLQDKSLEESRQVLEFEGSEGNNVTYLNTPVFLSHSIDDETVPVRNGRKLRDTLLRYGASVTWKEYETGGHWLNEPKGVDDLLDFLRSHVPGLFQNTN